MWYMSTISRFALVFLLILDSGVDFADAGELKPVCAPLTEANASSAKGVLSSIDGFVSLTSQCMIDSCLSRIQFLGEDVSTFSSSKNRPLELCLYSVWSYDLEKAGSPCVGKATVVQLGVAQPTTDHLNGNYGVSMELTYVIPSDMEVSRCVPIEYVQLDPDAIRASNTFSKRNARIVITPY